MTSLRVDAPDGAYHFGTEQNIIRRDHFEEQLDARKMVHTRVEEHVVADQLVERRPLHVLGKATVAAPVVRDRSTAMGDDESQRRKILEQIRRQKLHERRRV